MITRANAFLAALVSILAFASAEGADLPSVETFSFRTGDVSDDTLRAIASRVAERHQLELVGKELQGNEQAADRTPIVEYRQGKTVFFLARYHKPAGCVVAEFHVWGQGAERGAAQMREEFQQELTSQLADRLELHDHASCGQPL